MFLASAFAMSLGVSARDRDETDPKNVFSTRTEISYISASGITYNKYMAYAYESAYTFALGTGCLGFCLLSPHSKRDRLNNKRKFALSLLRTIT